jgi:hypothetical protein
MDCRDYASVKAALTPHELLPSQKRIRKWSLISSVIFGLVLAISIWIFINRFASPRTYQDTPILTGGAGVTILAVVLALSAYLRSVASASDEKREKIRGDEVPLYPALKPNEVKNGRSACTEEKLGALDRGVENLHIAAYFLIGLTFVASFRMFMDAIFKLSSSPPQWSQLFLRLCDVVILEWLTLTAAALAIMHRVARKHDERIRFYAEACRFAREGGTAAPPDSGSPK